LIHWHVDDCDALLLQPQVILLEIQVFLMKYLHVKITVEFTNTSTTSK